MTKTARAKGFKFPGRGYGREDWDSVSANPAWSEDDRKRARPSPSFARARRITRGRGRPRSERRRSRHPSPDPKRWRVWASGKDWRTGWPGSSRNRSVGGATDAAPHRIDDGEAGLTA